MTKDELRKKLRTARGEHVAAVPETMRGLVFHRPPAPLLELVPQGAEIGLYHAAPDEAPTSAYARFFQERGHDLALPYFRAREARMQFRTFRDPHAESDLEHGPFGPMPPANDSNDAAPTVLFVPLLGFTETGARLGQGGGHYDRWFAEHPETLKIGMAWDVQKVDHLPLEPHDIPLDAIVTPTRLYGPFR
ncbi:5-formyltetrahydrofolate cyclo-ligase [Qipengyuania sp. MTN3-11]|uniref:5-formyltetrahydrofolate cyclo-ligase n=1 Tax=Qipengyuania sp. MTN3-11 TaxID=3056557 RepID=UPI0036F25F05